MFKILRISTKFNYFQLVTKDGASSADCITMLRGNVAFCSIFLFLCFAATNAQSQGFDSAPQCLQHCAVFCKPGTVRNWRYTGSDCNCECTSPATVNPDYTTVPVTPAPPGAPGAPDHTDYPELSFKNFQECKEHCSPNEAFMSEEGKCSCKAGNQTAPEFQNFLELCADFLEDCYGMFDTNENLE